MKLAGVLGYLQAVKALRERAGPPDWKYSGFEALVLEWGIPFPPADLPNHVRRGRPRECYNNCLRLLAAGGGLIYCEGYAAGVIPVLHAWCITPGGEVVDPTWDGRQTHEYLGIPFDPGYVLEHARRTRYAAVIDDFKNGWPLLAGLDHQHWLHPNYERIKQQMAAGSHPGQCAR